MNLDKPRSEEGGFGHSRHEVDVADAPPRQPLEVTDTTTLQALHKDWRFFTHAIPLVYGKIPHDPVQEWINQQSQRSLVGILNSPDYRVFSGLKSFNHCLFACDKRYWANLRRFLSSLAVIDRDRQEFFRLFWHRIRVKDHLAMRRLTVLPDPIPTVPVTIFGLSSFRKIHYMKSPEPAYLSPEVSTMYPSPEDRAMGVSVLCDAPRQTTAPKMVNLKWNPKTEFFEPDIPPDNEEDDE